MTLSEWIHYFSLRRETYPPITWKIQRTFSSQKIQMHDLKARLIKAPLIHDYSLQIIQILHFTSVVLLQPILWLS